jgi:hypothetical protein
VDADGVADLLPGWDVRLAGADDWTDAIYRRRLGREITQALALAALLLLLVESAAAASGGAAARGRSASAARTAPSSAASSAGS